MVISIGGGSVIDAGKAIAAIITNRGNLYDYLEVIGKGQKLTEKPAPFVAVPTTAGTGAEVTKNAVITSPEHRVKVSLRSPAMFPDLAVVDPALTLSLPPALSACTGLDALTQCIESYVSCKSTPLTRPVCADGITRAARSLRTVCSDGSNLSAREDMALASLFSGLALANSGLGAVHGFAGPAGGMTGAPHGAVCALLLPGVMRTNITALETAHSDSPFLIRYREVAGLLTGDPAAEPADGVQWIETLCRDLPLPSGQQLKIEKNLFPDLATTAQKASSMKGNPVPLSREDLLNILKETF
jgi:alcohol dehydrogenase class IV